MARVFEPLSGLQVDLVKLLGSCALHLDQAQKDTERLRSRLASLPWDVMNDAGQGSLTDARLCLAQCEGKLAYAKEQIEIQRSRALKR
jgi:exonuclease VII small subunit